MNDRFFSNEVEIKVNFFFVEKLIIRKHTNTQLNYANNLESI